MASASGRLRRGIEGYGNSVPIEKQLRLPTLVIGSQSAAPLLWPLPVQIGVQLMGMFPHNGTPVGPAGGVLRFEMRDDRIVKIGMNGEVLGETLVDQPIVPALHPEMSMREQALAEEAERSAVAAKHADEGRAREVERQRKNDELENAEFARRQAAISR